MSKLYRRNNLYNKAVITKKISIPMRNVTSIINKTEDLNNYMKEVIEKEISNKCIVEGYIKPNSIIVLSYSNGILENQNIKFQIVFECLVCNPSEGQLITCTAKNITKAGIRAEVDDEYNPLIIFIARDHNYLNKLFSTIQVEQKIMVRVIGSRFELNDLKISVIGEIIKSSKLAKIAIGDAIDEPMYEDINSLVGNNDEVDAIDNIDNLEDELAKLESELADLEEGGVADAEADEEEGGVADADADEEGGVADADEEGGVAEADADEEGGGAEADADEEGEVADADEEGEVDEADEEDSESENKT